MQARLVEYAKASTVKIAGQRDRHMFSSSLNYKVVRAGIGLLFGLVLLFACLRNTNWAEIEHSIIHAKLAWIAFAVLLYWLELWLRIARWRTLLSHVTPRVDNKLVGIAFLSGCAANNVLPARLGEVFRADTLGRLSKISRFTAFGSIILERLLDMFVIVGMAAGGILMFTNAPAILDQIRQILLLIGAVLLAIVVVILLMTRKSSVFLPAPLQQFSVRFQHLLTGLHLIGDPSIYIKLILSSAAIWLLNSVAVWSILMALGVNLSIRQVLLLMGLIGISAAIPAAPAGIGTLQYAFYITFILVGLPTAVGIAASGIVQLALLGSATLAGGGVYYYALVTLLNPAKKLPS